MNDIKQQIIEQEIADIISGRENNQPLSEVLARWHLAQSAKETEGLMAEIGELKRRLSRYRDTLTLAQCDCQTLGIQRRIGKILIEKTPEELRSECYQWLQQADTARIHPANVVECAYLKAALSREHKIAELAKELAVSLTDFLRVNRELMAAEQKLARMERMRDELERLKDVVCPADAESISKALEAA